jgi:hypothetical protein
MEIKLVIEDAVLIIADYLKDEGYNLIGFENRDDVVFDQHNMFFSADVELPERLYE